MSESKKLIPRRRFREFEKSKEFCQVEWHKLVERLTVMSSAHCLPRVEFEDIISGQGELNKDVFKKINDKKGVEFKKGDILFGKLRPYLKNWLYAGFDGIAVGDFWVFRPTFSNGEFIYALIQTNQYQIVANQSTGTKMPRSDWNIVSNTKFIVTTNKIEQTQIGEFFKKLDNLINTQQKKLEKAKILKSAYLTEMFPNEGELKPRSRFKEFVDNHHWNIVQLGDVSDIIGGGTPSTSFKAFWDGDIDWYSPTEIGEKIFLNNSEKKITQLGLAKSSAKILPIGSILYTSRAGIGNTAILAKEGCTNQGFQSIVPHKSKLNSYFIYSRSKELKKYGQIKGAGSTFTEVSGKQLAQMPIALPDLSEQTKIGNFFKLLDNKIALEQKKLDKLKNIKQAYLNEMFV
jgi:type I restriction enzyme, S subunit